MELTLLYYLLAAIALTFAWYFRAEVTDMLYFATKNWKQTTFIIVCVFCGLLAGSSRTVTADISAAVERVAEPPEYRVAAKIAECKAFVAAKRAGQPHGPGDERAVDVGPLHISTGTYWDSCAKTFGMNYWKHDITIEGRNGGQLLCEAYRKGPYRSADVNGWCDTVFATTHGT